MSHNGAVLRTIAGVGVGSVLVAGIGGPMVAKGFPRDEPGSALTTGQIGVGLVGLGLVAGGVLLPLVGVTDQLSSVTGAPGKAAVVAAGVGATLLAGAAAFGGWSLADRT